MTNNLVHKLGSVHKYKDEPVWVLAAHISKILIKTNRNYDTITAKGSKAGGADRSYNKF
jgi:hypothetical protein